MNVDATKIKVGDQIKFRNGKIETVSEFKYNPDPVDTYSCEVTFESGCHIEYTTGGGYWDDGEDDGRDIVEIIPAETSEEPAQDEMTLRDQFAMAALSALLQGASTKAAEESVAKDAYFFADKMMQARKENN